MFQTRKLYSVEETAKLTFPKLTSKKKDELGLTEKEAYQKHLKNLQKFEENFGVLHTSTVAELFGFPIQTVNTWTSRKRHQYFPKALILEPRSITDVRRQRLLINIFHKQFVDYIANSYNPKEFIPKQCKLNTLFFETICDENNQCSQLPVDYLELETEENGVVKHYKVDRCKEYTKRNSNKFCSPQHHTLYRLLDKDENGRNRFQIMGQIGGSVRKIDRLNKHKRVVKVILPEGMTLEEFLLS